MEVKEGAGGDWGLQESVHGTVQADALDWTAQDDRPWLDRATVDNCRGEKATQGLRTLALDPSL